MNKYILLDPRKKLAQIPAKNTSALRRFKENTFRCTPIHKNDVTVPNATLKTSKGRFQQSFCKFNDLFWTILFANGC